MTERTHQNILVTFDRPAVELALPVERGDGDGGGAGGVQRGRQHVAAPAGRVPRARALLAAARAVVRALPGRGPERARRRPAGAPRPAPRPLGLLARLQDLRLRGHRGSLLRDLGGAPRLPRHAELHRAAARAAEDSGALVRTDIRRRLCRGG